MRTKNAIGRGALVSLFFRQKSWADFKSDERRFVARVLPQKKGGGLSNFLKSVSYLLRT